MSVFGSTRVKLLMVGVVSGNFCVQATPVFAKAPDPAEMRRAGADDAALRALDAANGLLRRELFDLAEPEFRKLLATSADEEVLRLARYGLAVCLVRQDRARDAAGELEVLAGEGAFTFAGEVQMMLGHCRLALDQPVDAARAFEQVVRKHPQHALADAARAGLVEALYRAGHHAVAVERAGDFAETIVEPALRARTRYFEALAGMGVAEYARAGEALETLLREHPDSELIGPARLLLGQCQARAGNFAAALATFERCGSAVHEDVEAGYWLAKCHARLGDHSAAQAVLDRFLQDHGDAPLAANAQFDLAAALVNQEQFAAAERALEGFAERYPGSGLEPAALHASAVAAYRRGDDATCGVRLQSFLEAHADHELFADALFLAGASAQRAQRWAEALRYCDEFAERFPGDERAAEARYRAGLAAYELEHTDEARRRLAQLAADGALPVRFLPAALVLGDIALQVGAWAEAEKWFSTYLAGAADGAGRADALLKRGIARARLNRLREAVADFEALNSCAPQKDLIARAQYELGAALAALGDHAAAQRAFEAAGRGEGGNELVAAAAYQQAVLAMTGRDYQSAIGHWTRVIETVADAGATGDAATQRGEAMFQRGQCRVALSDFAGALADFRAVAERGEASPRAADARAWSVVALSRQGLAKDALAAYGQLSRDDLSRVEPATRATLLSERAFALRADGRTAEALSAYRELLELQELDAAQRAHAELAVAELTIEQEGCGGGLERLRRITDAPIDSTQPEVRERALYRLGRCAHEAQSWEQAAQALEALIEEFPQSPFRAAALLYAGEALARLGRDESACGRFQSVIDAHPDDEACALAMLRLGECLARRQQWAGSEQVLTEFLERFGDHPQWFAAQFGVGWARENQQRFPEAIAAYRRVTQRHAGATAARAQFQIGECLFAQGELAAAVTELLKVDILYDYPEWSAAGLYEAGRCLEQLNRGAEARAQFEAVVQRFGDSPWARSAADRLPRMAGAASGH